MTITVNTIQDNQGNKLVLTNDQGISKLWYGRFYDFTREVVQVSYVDVFKIEADGFNHAIEKIQLERDLKKSYDSNKILRLKLQTFEDKILKSRKLSLIGKQRQSKLNHFLRN